MNSYSGKEKSKLSDFYNVFFCIKHNNDSMKKAISTLIASTLVLMIVVALGGTSYLYISNALTGKTSQAFEMTGAIGDVMTIRNIGTGTLASFSTATIDGNPANYLVSRGNSALALQTPQTHTVRVESKGYSATIGDRGVWIDGLKIFTTTRSYGLVVLDYNAQATFSSNYDVYGNAANAAALASKLNSLVDGTIIVISTHDEPQTNRLTNGLPAALYRCGASKAIFESANFKYRSAYLLVGVCGNGEASGFEKYAGAVDNDPNAWIRGDITIGGGVGSGQDASIKVYGISSKGMYTFRLCTPSVCNTAYLTIA